MPIDRKLWLGGFSEGDVPPWPCPKCGKGVLHLNGTPCDDNQKKMDFPIIERRDAQSSRDMHRASWHPMEDGGVFAAILQCNRDPSQAGLQSPARSRVRGKRKAVEPVAALSGW